MVEQLDRYKFSVTLERWQVHQNNSQNLSEVRLHTEGLCHPNLKDDKG